MSERRLKIENLQIDEVSVFKNEEQNVEGFTIHWSANIGFGEYVIYKDTESGKWYADTECMDSNTDKSFGEMLLKLFIQDINIQ